MVLELKVVCEMCGETIGDVPDDDEGHQQAFDLAMEHCERLHSEQTWPESPYYTTDY